MSSIGIGIRFTAALTVPWFMFANGFGAYRKVPDGTYALKVTPQRIVRHLTLQAANKLTGQL
jgi:hypothetical protein